MNTYKQTKIPGFKNSIKEEVDTQPKNTQAVKETRALVETLIKLVSGTGKF